MKTQYNGIHIMKIICAFAIVYTHSRGAFLPTNTNSFHLFEIFRFAVPFFFITAGYFFCRGLHTKPDKLRHLRSYVFKIFLMYLIWTVLYSPFDFIIPMLKAGFTKNGLEIFIRYFISLLVLGSHYHLWFLLALMAGISLCYFLYRKTNIYVMIGISAVCFFFGVMGSAYYMLGLQIPIFGNTLTRYYYELLFVPIISRLLGTGLPFLVMGFVLYKFRVRPPLKFIVPGLILSILVFYSETYILSHYAQEIALNFELTVGVLPLSLFTFLLAQHFELPKLNRYSKSLNIFSTAIYLAHPLAIIFIYKALETFKLPLNQYILFACTALGSTFFVLIVMKINNKYLNSLIGVAGILKPQEKNHAV